VRCFLQIWNECARLISNCIIYYNTLILSHLLVHKEENGESHGADQLKKISPVALSRRRALLFAWQHINLSGRYEFSKATEEININAIVKQLATSGQIPKP